MNSVLITGVGGFLGALIAKSFRESGWRVMGFGRRVPWATTHESFTVTELPSRVVEDAIRQEKPDVCVHCAGNSILAFRCLILCWILSRDHFLRVGS